MHSYRGVHIKEQCCTMAYIWTILSSVLSGLTTICSKTYMTNTKHVKTNVDLYLLFIYPLMTLYYFLLAGGKVSLNWPTFWFALAFAIANLLSTRLNMVVYNHATIVYITVFAGASMILPFFYELLFTNPAFSVWQYIAVVLRILAVCIPLFSMNSEESITKKGFVLCFFLFLTSGTAGIITRMFASHPNVMSDGSYFFWINVFILPSAMISIFRKATPGQLYADFRKIKFYNFLLMLLAAVISNAFNFISIELIRQVTATVYHILSGSVQILVMAFLSTVIYGEKMSPKAAMSLSLSLCAVILSLL